MSDIKSVLRTVTRVIEAELKPEAVVILVRMPDGESYVQPGGYNLKVAALVLQAAARVAVTFGDKLNAEATEQKEEQK